jgi:hypothetical protein
MFQRIAEDRGIEPQEQLKRLTNADSIYARLVQRMLDLHQHQQAANSEAARERLPREINVTDEKIDQSVYELCGSIPIALCPAANSSPTITQPTATTAIFKSKVA